ncbi:MAG: hypothetical protein ACI9ZD_002617, partial [Paracoccaceae bacterium]
FEISIFSNELWPWLPIIEFFPRKQHVRPCFLPFEWGRSIP